MSDSIKLLPDNIANQIAAGEVVQRPASVVKELLENSIDAGANHIQLIVKDAGKSLIEVKDNGYGMSETDARMSFERHATSKLRKAEDLFNITTMGFRGEALASIAAVAQVEMLTRLEENELGTKIIIEGGKLTSQEPGACVQGTKISVKNLFFNIPARRNFLKSNPVELRHLMDDFVRVALANPSVAFTCYQNDLEVYKLKTGKLSQRIIGLFGKNYRENLIPVKESSEYVSIRGYIGKPEQSKKTRGDQYYFVNNRFIKSNYLNMAVANAFSGLIPQENFPFFTLFIDIDPRHVDVNVHPTKTEIKFDDERSVFAFIKSSVRQALGTHNITPSLDFTFDTNFQSSFTSTGDGEMKTFSSGNKQNQSYERFSDTDKLEKSNLKNWEQLFEGASSHESLSAQARQEFELPADDQQENTSSTIKSAANELEGPNAPFNPVDRQVFQVNNCYVCTPMRSGLMIVHQRRAHQRILFERYLRNFQKHETSTQQLLFHEKIELTPAEHTLSSNLKEDINQLGFIFEDFGNNCIVISGIPSDLQGNTEEIFKGLLNDFEKTNFDLNWTDKQKLAASLAHHASMKKGALMAKNEMTELIDQLFACENPNYTPKGSETYFILQTESIEDFFKE